MLPQKVYAELVDGSGIDRELVDLNISYLKGQQALNALLYSDKLKRRNDGRLAGNVLNQYSHVEKGGWHFTGVNLLTGEDAIWGCLKPDYPRLEQDRKRPIKYEHPKSELLSVFAPKVSVAIAKGINRIIGHNISSEESASKEFWEAVASNPKIPLLVTEGCKKTMGVLTAGYAAIGLPGVGTGTRTPRDKKTKRQIGDPDLIPELKLFAQPGRSVIICFDEDSKRTTRREVNRAIRRLSYLLQKKGCRVLIATWDSGFGKGIDDVLVAHGREKVEEIIRGADTYEIWKVRQTKVLTYEPDLIVNLEKLTYKDEASGRYFPAVHFPEDAQLIAVKSPKFTAKTGLFSCWVAPVLESGENRILSVIHRIQLGVESCKRLGIPWVDDEDKKLRVLGYGLVTNSMHPKSRVRFNPEDFYGSWIILDEIEQVLWYLVSDPNSQQYRTEILRCFRETIKQAIAGGGKIFIADADLSDTAIDFIKSIIGYEIKTWICLNNYKPSPNKAWTVYRYEGKNPCALLNQLVAQIESGKRKHFVCLNGQRPDSKFSTQGCETWLKKKFPELKVLRIDGDTSKDPEHPASKSRLMLSELIAEYDVILASPVIETGVSIENVHFDAVWGAFYVQPSNSVRQSLGRVRANVPRHIWVKTTSSSRIGNGSASPSSLRRSQKRPFKVNLKLLGDVVEGLSFADGENTCKLELDLFINKAASINLEMGRYAETVFTELAEEGHLMKTYEDIEIDGVPIKELEPEQKAEIADSVSQIEIEIGDVRDEVYSNYREQVTTVPSPDDDQYKELKKRQSKTQFDLYQERKGDLERRYGVTVTPDLIQKDDKHWKTKLEYDYYFGVGQEFLSPRDKNILRSMIENGNGFLWVPDVNRRMMGAKIAFLQALGVKGLMEAELLSEGEQVVQEFDNRIVSNADDVRNVLGISISKTDSAMKHVQQVLELFGKKAPCIAQKRDSKTNKRLRIYGTPAPAFEEVADSKGDKKLKLVDGKPIPLDDGREAVFAAWLERDRLALEKAAAVTEAEKAVVVEQPVEIEQPVTVQSIEVVNEPRPLELLAIRIADCQTREEFKSLLATNEKATVEDAIVTLDDAASSHRFYQWLNEIESGSTANTVELTEAEAEQQLSQQSLQVDSQSEEIEASANPPLSFYKPGDEAWFYYPPGEQKWLKGIIEKIMGRTIQIRSGFCGRWIENPMDICPGDWELVGA